MTTAAELLSMNATILCDALTIASSELFLANDTFIHQQMMKRHEFASWDWNTHRSANITWDQHFDSGLPAFQPGREKQTESFWKTFRRTCWMKQRTANNSFIPWTTNFHKQNTNTEVIAMESHVAVLHMDVKSLVVRWERSLVCIIHSSILASFGRGMGKYIAPKVPGLTVQRAAGSDTGDAANEWLLREINLPERDTELLKSRRDVVTFYRR